MVAGPPSYIYGTYTMCAFYGTRSNCEGEEECPISQLATSPNAKAYLAAGEAFATISYPPPSSDSNLANLPGLEMTRFITPLVVPTQTIYSETGYIGQFEVTPFQTRDSQIKARFEQVYLNQTDQDYRYLSGTNLYLDCTFPNEDTERNGWDMVCIGNFDSSIFQQLPEEGVPTRVLQQLFYVKGDNSTACDGVPTLPVVAAD